MDQMPGQPPHDSAPKPSAPSDLWKFDAKTIDVMKWSAIFAASARVIDSVASWVAGTWFASRAFGVYGSFGYGFNVGGLVRGAIMAAIYGAIGGFILIKFYNVFMRWQAKYLKGKLNNLFKLLFWPTVVGALVSLFLLSPFGFVVGFGTIIVSIVGSLVSRFVYAKGMDQMVGKYFR